MPDVMAEFEAGTLRTGSGALVTSLRQAKAIAANVKAKEATKKVSKPRKALTLPLRDRAFFLKIGR
jgi:hypothetical protein